MLKVEGIKKVTITTTNPMLGMYLFERTRSCIKHLINYQNTTRDVNAVSLIMNKAKHITTYCYMRGLSLMDCVCLLNDYPNKKYVAIVV